MPHSFFQTHGHPFAHVFADIEMFDAVRARVELAKSYTNDTTLASRLTLKLRPGFGVDKARLSGDVQEKLGAAEDFQLKTKCLMAVVMVSS